MSNGPYRYNAKVFRYHGLPESALIDYSFVLLVLTRSIFYDVTATNELCEVYKVLISAKTLCFMTFFLLCHCYQCKKGGMLHIFKMWIPRYIDVNPHFSQNILNKGIFQMWIPRYIDMNPHKSKHV